MEKKALRFEFVSYELKGDQKTVELNYAVEFEGQKRLQFTEKVVLPNAVNSDGMQVDQVVLKSTLQTLHLISGLSYWKMFCPPTIITAEPLSKEQAEFWNVVYTKGLGEFFFKNKIDYRGLVKFPYQEGITSVATPLKRQKRAIIGVGGGKDSIVTGELLKKAQVPTTAFLLETQKEYALITHVVQKMGIDALHIKRELDPQVLNSETIKGSFNGHIPITAIYSAIGLLCAVLYDYEYVVMSNEQSANYGNVEYLGQEINHQWSKSEEFEKLFSSYIHKNITEDIQYFSLLRPWTEMRIVKEFVNYPEYFSTFSSCNNNFKIQKDLALNSLWCGHCPKCAFVFCMLAAYLSKEECVKIFGKNLYADEALLDLYKELLGKINAKPFECVGTPEEVTAAFYKAYKKGEYNEEVIMQYFEKEVLPTVQNPESLVENAEKSTASSFIPAELQNLVI